MEAKQVVFPPWEQLAPHQIEVLRSPQRFKTLVWHRRARKTTTALIELVRQAQTRIGPYWHVFPTYAQAKDAVWRDPNMLQRIIPEALITKKNEQELVVYFKNGSYIQLKGADDPDTIRGAGPVGLVLDEFDQHKAEVWEITEPILRGNQGWAWFIGTPKGKDKLFRSYTRGVEDFKNNGDKAQWKSWLLKASTSGIIPLEELDEARKGMSDPMFKQEFECAWLEGSGTVFRGLLDIIYNSLGEPLVSPQQPVPEHIYVIGADLAKLHDFTVLTVYDIQTNSQVYQDRFQTLEWPFQKKKIAELSNHYNRARVILDATGLGDPVADDLLRAGIPVEPFKLTETTKKELIEKLSIWIEQRKIKMLPIEQTIREFDDFTYKMGETGKIHYGAPNGEGFFDDCVISHALAVWALNPLYQTTYQKPLTMIQQEFNRQLNEYERDLEYGSEEF